jgi:hypothetical protein
MAKEQFAKVTVLVERTYLIPIKDGRSINGESAEEIREQWFGNPTSLNKHHVSRDGWRLGGADIIRSSEISEIVDVPDGTI